MRNYLLLVLAVVLFGGTSGVARGQVPDWPGVFDPHTVLNLNLQTVLPDCTTPDPAAWPVIQQDLTFSLEYPALFWADGETPICVTVRRKSSDTLGDPGDPKVGLKVDINELIGGQRWHGVRKLSLENGDDVNPAAEGIAWQLHKLAADAPGAPAGHIPNLAAWVTLNVNGTGYGVYINVENGDKSLLQNRAIYDAGQSWLYKNAESFEAKVPTASDPNAGVDSSTHLALCYPPFTPATCATPDNATLETQLEALVDMDQLLYQGAVEAFIVAPDGILSAGHNYYFADWDPVLNRKRRYYPWDLDTVFTKVDESIYCRTQGMNCNQSEWQSIILGHPTYGPQFDQLMRDLLAGPFTVANLTTLVTDMENVISAPLKADPNNQIGTAADVDQYFNDLRQYMTDRVANVNAFVACPSDTDGDGVCDASDNCPTIANGAAQAGIPGVGEQLDSDGDTFGDACDIDDDNDGIADGSDPISTNPDVCGDSDADSCDDCAIGTDDFGGLVDSDPSNDGVDTDGDGACDLGDPDNDNDGATDGMDLAQLDPNVCHDLDADSCDDCSVGTDDFGPLVDADPSNDGLDTDFDGACNAGDPDDDEDGLLDEAETDTGIFVSAADTGTDPLVADTDGDGFDDGEEVAAMTDPNDPVSNPNAGVPVVPALGPVAAGVLSLLVLGLGATLLPRRGRRRAD